MSGKQWFDLLKLTASEWMADNASRLGAALAYYTVFSLAPLLVLVLAIAGVVFGEEAARGQLTEQLTDILGEQGAAGVEGLIASAQKPREGLVATVMAVAALILGALGIFGQLKASLNTIWSVQPSGGGGVWRAVKDRLFSFAMVLVIAFLLLASLVVSAVLAGMSHFVDDMMGWSDTWMRLADVAVSFGLFTVLFAMVFKLLPDVTIAWTDVWRGAFVTALLFTLGKFLIGLYLGNAAIGSTYGAAGSVVIILLWAYYSSQIFFFGAEFIKVYARQRGVRILPSANAVALSRPTPIKSGDGAQARGREVLGTEKAVAPDRAPAKR